MGKAARTVPGYSVGSLKKRITRRHYYKESAGCFLRLKVKAGCLKSQAPRQGCASRQGERGNKPYDLERMRRIYLVQNLYNLSDMATVAEVIDSRAFSDFCGVESGNQVPDGDTLGRFRNILIRNGIQQELFAQAVELLMQRGLILKRGTIVGSTFIEAPSSTKNEKKERDPEAHSAKKAMYGTLAIKPIWE